MARVPHYSRSTLGITYLECPLFEPDSDEPIAGVDIYLTQAPLANVGELVRRLRRDDDDLPRLPFERLAANGEERSPCEDDKYFFIGMLVQPNTFVGFHLYPEE